MILDQVWYHVSCGSGGLRSDKCQRAGFFTASLRIDIIDIIIIESNRLYRQFFLNITKIIKMIKSMVIVMIRCDMHIELICQCFHDVWINKKVVWF